MWNSSMEPGGHMGLKSYFFFGSFVFSLWVATVIHQVTMASDYLPKSKGMHAHPHSWSRARPGDWFPGDTSIDGNECARIISAKLLRKLGAPWCVMHTPVKAAVLRVYQTSSIIRSQNGATCGRKSPALVPLLLSCSGGGNMQTVDGSRPVKLGFIVTLSLAWSHGSPGSSFWDPGKKRRMSSHVVAAVSYWGQGRGCKRCCVQTWGYLCPLIPSANMVHCISRSCLTQV